jgi:hypothetical protein
MVSQSELEPITIPTIGFLLIYLSKYPNPTWLIYLRPYYPSLFGAQDISPESDERGLRGIFPLFYQ